MMDHRASRVSPASMVGMDTGSVLLPVLLLLALLTMLGNMAVTTSTIETKSAGNYMKSVRAFYAGEAGLEEAKTRLKGLKTGANYAGDPAATPDASWSAYLLTDGSWTTSSDQHYNSSLKNYIPTTTNHTATAVSANSLQPDITYWVKLRYKREYDAENAGHTVLSPLYKDQDGDILTHTASVPGSIIYYGYQDNTSSLLEEYTTSSANSATGVPVLIVASYGHDGGKRASTSILEVELRKRMGPPILGAVYGDTFDGSGAASTANGNDYCGQAGPVTAVAYSSDSATPNPQNTQLVSDAASTTYVTPLDIAGIVADLQDMATIVLTGSSYTGATYGSSTNYEVVYVDATDFTGSQVAFSNLGQTTPAYGTLVIVGNASFSGNLAWKGLVIATGNVTFSGGGSTDYNVEGAILAGNMVDLNGNIDVVYNSCEVANARSAYRYHVARWEDASLS